MISLSEFLKESYTAYHAVANVAEILRNKGFSELKENEDWKIEVGGRYFVIRDGSALIAFVVGEKGGYNIVASHSDSPMFKIKGSPNMSGEYFRLNCEAYGGGLYYSFLDRPLRPSGRITFFDDSTGRIQSKVVTGNYNVVIPSLAIHMNREANKKLELNAQVDMIPLAGLNSKADFVTSLVKGGELEGKEIVDYDIYLASDEKPFMSGVEDEFLCSPRIDNLSSVLSSVLALMDSNPKTTAVAAVLDNEEVGSSTKQGAGGTFLADVVKRISKVMGRAESFETDLCDSFMVSLDNAHAVHPNHPEKCDPTNRPVMGKGIVVKHHANQAYTSDSISSAVIKSIFKKAGADFQDYYNRSDMASGGTLGAISSRQLSIRSVDIGLAQLAMHSACETVAIKDYETMLKGIKAFYETKLKSEGYSSLIIE